MPGFQPQIVFTPGDCWWTIPLAWWRMVAQPRFETLVLAGARDVDLITYNLLERQTGPCPLPPSPQSVVSPPNDPNFWPGPPTMIYLFQHVREAVAVGLQRWDGESRPLLALPSDVLEKE